MVNIKGIRAFLHDAKAVSPAIATLILIVIAAVAAAGVGILVQSSQKNAADQTADKDMSVMGTINIKGSSTILPITQDAAEDFTKKYPAVDIVAAAGGSGAGRQLVWQQLTDIGASSDIWPDKAIGDIPNRDNAVIQAAGSADAKIWETQIGSGMIVVAANLGSGVTSINVVNGTPTSATPFTGAVVINFNDLKALYENNTGALAIAGIKPVQRKDPGGTEEVFAKWIGLVGSDKQLSVTTQEENGNQGIRDYIAANPNTIGFVDIGFAENGVNGKTGVKAATQNGVAANTSTKGINGPYNKASDDVNSAISGGLARDLYYYSYGTPQGAVKAYLDFIVGLEGQKIVEGTGFYKIN
ncbi:MAG: substrate-binding domain-containing protein [Candidatus Methanoperedens sp.]